MDKGQSTIELMTIVAVALIVLAVLVNFTAEQVNYIEKQRAAKTAELSVQMLIDAADELYTQGPGATRFLQLTWPEGVETTGTRIEDHSIIVNVYGSYISGTAIPNLVGTLPTNSGLQNIRVRAFDGFVMIGELDISSNPTSIFSSLDRNTSSSTTVILTNHLTNDIPANQASIAIASNWSYPDVNIVISPSSGILDAADALPFDVNFFASASAVGTYAGKITVTAAFPSKVETLIIPIQVNVNVGSSPNLVAFPSSISMSTFGIDTNSTTFQLCNVGTTTIKTISITPSSGAPGSWLNSFSTIDSLNAQTCRTIDVNVSVPTNSISPFAGSLSISDYTGANAISVPVTINVLGMSSVFSWDWSPAIRSVQSIYDFTLSNRGRKPIQISAVTLRGWWSCDSQHSLWNSLVVNNTSRFIGSLQDGNTADITDFNIPILTSYADNALSFSNNIQDQNEPFVADVNFSDGTQFTTSTFGGSCDDDNTFPATILNLTANPGPEPQSVQLQFTIPGDDNYSGLATSYVFNYSLTQSPIPDQNSVVIYPDVYYTDPNQGIVPGGTPVSWVFSDLNVGMKYYFYALFFDNVDNNSGYSNSPNSVAWNRFSWSGNDFNFVNFSPEIPTPAPIDVADITQFDLNIFSVAAAGADNNMVIRIVDDYNTDHSWIGAITFTQNGGTGLYTMSRSRIWYPAGNASGIPAATPQYDGNSSFSTSGHFDLLDTDVFNSGYRIGGNRVLMRRPNHVYIDILDGITDFNIVFNNSFGDEIMEGPSS